jgi:hypothetical protein
MENDQDFCLRTLIEDLLLDHGTVPTDRLLRDIGLMVEDQSFQIGAEMVARLIQKLDKRQRILWEQLLRNDLPLSESADLAGVSAVAIHRQTKRLEKRLMKPTKVE